MNTQISAVSAHNQAIANKASQWYTRYLKRCEGANRHPNDKANIKCELAYDRFNENYSSLPISDQVKVLKNLK